MATLEHVNPVVKYTLARLGLFAAVFLLLLPVQQLSMLLRLMIAILFSASLGWFLLRGMRDQVAEQMAGSVERRRQDKEKLRAALAGEQEQEQEPEPEPERDEQRPAS